jgi:hypothetical protein
MGRLTLALFQNLKNDLAYAFMSFALLLFALFLVTCAFGFGVASGFMLMLDHLSPPAAAASMAGLFALCAFIILLGIGVARKIRNRPSLTAEAKATRDGAVQNGPDPALNNIAEWLERSGYVDEALAVRSTVALARQTRPYPLVAISFVVGIISGLKLTRGGKS